MSTESGQEPETVAESRPATQLLSSASNSTVSEDGMSKSDKPNWCEVATFWVEIVGLIGLAVYCAYTIREWKTFDSERQIMRDEFNAAESNAELEERAWVVTTDHIAQYAVPPGGGEAVDVYFDIYFKNTGKTPGINVVTVIGQYGDTNHIPETDPYPNPVYHSETLGPDVGGILTGTIFPPAYPEGNLKAIKNKKPYFLAGTIWYDDIFGKHHWSQFCYQADFELTGMNLLPMPVHFSCDDAERRGNK